MVRRKTFPPRVCLSFTQIFSESKADSDVAEMLKAAPNDEGAGMTIGLAGEKAATPTETEEFKRRKHLNAPPAPLQ